MPKISPAIPNELILAHLADRSKLSDELWIIPPQLGMLLGRSTGQIEDDRKAGNPPLSMKPWGEKGPVRYRLGTVRDFMLGPAAEEYQNTTQARIGLEKRATIGFVSFLGWIDESLPADKWPFLIRNGSAPVDFFKSLGMGEALRDDDECAWLRLDDYLTLRKEAALHEEARATKVVMEATVEAGEGCLDGDRRLNNGIL